MRTLKTFVAVLFTLLTVYVVVCTITIDVNGEENKPKPNDKYITFIIISARYGEDYKITGHTYKQFTEIKAAIKKVNDLKENKHIYGIDHYNLMFSTVLSGLKVMGITVKKAI